MKNAKNPYGQGNSAEQTVDAIQDYYNKGLLDIKSPEDIMQSFERKMTLINEDITVKQFEGKNNALIHMVFDGEKMHFPVDDLNIKEKYVTYDKYL